jgi:hypothetical protein
MQTATSTPAIETAKSVKIGYVDNLKVVLTVLVILHHAFITYGAPGSWYYNEKTTHQAALIPMTLFVAVNQSFFMGFFFFLSAYFTESSYKKKGAVKFIGDRLKRLGIPLIFYSFILSPFLSFMVYKWGEGHNITYLQYLGGFHHWIDFGVLWFVAALLLFSLLYVALMVLFKNAPMPVGQTPPKPAAIILGAITLALGSYLIRCVFPIGWVLQPVGFQLGHFAQYVVLFALGIVASRGLWLSKLSFKTGRLFTILALLMVIVMFPVLFYLLTVTKSPIDELSGHGSWQSLVYACWEQLTGIFIIVALLGTARQKWNEQSSLFKKLARLTFCVYIFHPLVLIGLSVLLKPWGVDPAVKLLLVGPGAVAGSFLLAGLLIKVPGVKVLV